MVVSIKILTERIKSIIAPVHAIRVQHRYDFEDKFVSQDLCLLARLIRQELPDAIENKRGWSLAWMHTR